MQTLQVGKGYVNVRRQFRGASILPKRGMVGTEVVELAAGSPAPPDIAEGEHGGYYYFGNPLKPVTDPAHVQHLPYKRADGTPVPGSHLDLALKFIERNKQHPAPAIRPAKDKAKVQARAAAKPVKPRRIKTEKDLRRETGGVTVEHAMAQGG